MAGEKIGDMTVSDFLKQLVNGDNNSAPKTTVKDSSVARTDGIDNLNDKANTAAGGLRDLFTATTGLAFGFGAATQKIGDESIGVADMMQKLNVPGSKFAAGLASASSGSGVLGDVRAQSSSGLGASFMAMRNDLRSAGLTVQDYTAIMRQSNGSLNFFGATAKERAEDLAGAGAKLQKLANESGMNLNMGQEELGKIMILSQMGRKEQLSTGQAQERAAVSANKLAETITDVANRTGKSRDVIEAEMAERLSSAEVSAKLRLADEDQRNAIIQTQAQLSGMGKTAADTATAIQNGGRLTNEQIGSLQAMGGKAAGEFLRANRLIAQGRNEEGNALLEKARIDKANFQATPQFARLLNSSTPEVQGYLRRSVSEDFDAGGARFAQQQNRGTSLTPVEIERQREQQAINTRKGRLESGQYDPNVAPTAAAAAINNRSFQASVETLQLFNKNLSDLAASANGQKILGEVIHKIYGKGGELEQSVNAQLKILKDLVAAKPPVGSGPQANVPPTPTNTTPPTPTNTTPPTPTNTTPPTPTNTTPPKPTAPSVVPNPPGMATGGPVDSNKLYMVGENGPELFKSSIPGDIISNDKLSSMFGDIKTKISSSIPKLDFSKTPGLNTDSIEQARQEAIKATSPVANTATTTATNPLLGGSGSGEVTLKDIYTSLQQLNKTMGQVASHSETISQHSEKTARMSAKATGNRTFA